MTLRKPINDQASYSMHLAELSNLAFNKKDVARRITGKKQLDAIIRKSYGWEAAHRSRRLPPCSR